LDLYFSFPQIIIKYFIVYRLVLKQGDFMKITVDRLLMVLLIIGIWALVFKPNLPKAHSGQYCDIESGYGFGDADEYGSVYVYSITGTVYCW
tara:strand:- start:233 stop:508 length:276 start_codon:yes stop_codon:yes gene_type:complete